MEAAVRKLVETRLQCRITDSSLLGQGASGFVYKVSIDTPPYCLALKISHSPALMLEEYSSISFMSSRVDCKLPKPYFADVLDDKGIFAMEYLSGVQPSRKALWFRKNKRKLANEIVDNLIKIHTVQHDKYGPIQHAVYDSWYAYYSQFAQEIAAFTEETTLPPVVKKAVRLGCDRLYPLLGNEQGKATLIHGDYWIPNLLVDPKHMTLTGVLDPFHVLWAEPEYELFTLTVGYGKQLRLYELYKSKVKTSEACDTKVELYALFNELLWYKTLGKIGVPYLTYRSKRLIKALS